MFARNCLSLHDKASHAHYMEFDSKDIERFRALIDSAHTIVLTTHLSPDGDAIGSTTGFAHLLQQMGKDVLVVTPDQMAAYLEVIPGATTLVRANSCHPNEVKRWFAKADVVLCMDYNGPSRISRVQPLLMSCKAPRVLIDHHLWPEDFCDIVFSEPHLSSTCELTAHLIKALGWFDRMDYTTATCLCAGILTDTGGLQYNNNSPELYVTVADLLRNGIDIEQLTRFLLNTKKEGSMKLESFCISNKLTVWPEYHAALIWVSQEELNRYGYKSGDTEGLVNKPLQIPGVVYSMFVHPREDYIRISMRSVGDFPVNRLCSSLFTQGGGHLNAAGAENNATMEQTIQTIIASLPDNAKLISERTLQIANRDPKILANK